MLLLRYVPSNQKYVGIDMFLKETAILFIVAFVLIPISVESWNCTHPLPDGDGAVCDWDSKNWDKKFDLETLQYYYVLRDVDPTDNFVEKRMRERYHKKRSD